MLFILSLTIFSFYYFIILLV